MKVWLAGERSCINKGHLLFVTCRHVLRFIVSVCLMQGLCVADCPTVCDCKWKDGKESVMCIDTNLSAIPMSLDPGVLVFNFVGNSMLTLGNDVFEMSGLVNLQKLHLVRCNIKYIERYAFRSLKNLVDLDLSQNVLTIVPSQAFAPIPDLRELKLNGNPILKIGSYAFTHVHQLVRLEISHCRIGYIDEKAFSGLEKSLEWLKLKKNRLENMKPETFTVLQALHGLDFSENPLNCSCDLRPLREWMSAQSLSVGTMPTCKYPMHASNKSWDRLHDDDFACLPSIQAPVKMVNAYEGDNVTLICRMEGVPTPDVTWTLRNRILLNSSFEYPVTNRRSYLIHSVSNNYSNLTILSLDMQDMGEYVCVAENKAGKVIADIALMIEKAPIGTILSEKAVLVGILITAISIVFLCSIIVFIRVMYCKHDTQADIESKRRIISEKIEMKRNSANLKRSSSVLPARIDPLVKINTDDLKTEPKLDKYPLNSIAEEDGLKVARPKYLNELKPKANAVAAAALSTAPEPSQSPSSSIFESHIGEMALQHHVLHKKQLPSGNLYTTAMAFMTDDAMMNYANEDNTNFTSSAKKANYNTLPRNYAPKSGPRKSVYMSNEPRVSESQSPLLKHKYYGSSSESVNSNIERSVAAEYDHYASYHNSSPPVAVRKSKKNWYSEYPSLPSSPDKDRYWEYSSGSLGPKKSPLLNNNICNKKSRNCAANHAPPPSLPTTSYSVESAVANTTYDYHAAQLERFLDEYKKLHSELTKMKDTCEKLGRQGESGSEYLQPSYRESLRRNHTHRSKLSLSSRCYDTNSFERRYNSKGSLHRTLPSKSRSFERPLPPKSCSFERSVSFVPTLKDNSVKSATSDDVIVPKSILKKKGETYYRNYKAKNYIPVVGYGSSTLPTRRSRLRRFSDSSMNRFFG